MGFARGGRAERGAEISRVNEATGILGCDADETDCSGTRSLHLIVWSRIQSSGACLPQAS
jgi:hypothetical protein